MNINKLIILLGFGVLLTSIGYADLYKVPQGRSGDLRTSYYGGVDYSTFSVSSAAVQMFAGPGTFQGVICGEVSKTVAFFMVIRDTAGIIGGSGLTTAGADYTTGGEAFRVTVSTNLEYTGKTVLRNTEADTGTKGFYFTPDYPVRVKRGAVLKMSTVGPTNCSALGTKDQ